MAAPQNFSLTAGDTGELDFSAYQADGTTPLDLTGADIVWKMTRFPGDAADPVVSKATGGGGITITSTSAGTFKVALDPADTADIAPLRYFHGVKVTDGAGNISTIATGFCVIRQTAVLDVVP